MIELYWIHLSTPNPSQEFWNSVESLPHVSVHAEIGEDTAARRRRDEILAQLLRNPASEEIQRLALLHLADVTECFGQPLEAVLDSRFQGSADPNLTVIYFTKGTADHTSSPPIFGLTEEILPNLEGPFLEALRQNERLTDVSSLFFPSRSADTATDIADADFVGFDVLIQGAIAVLESNFQDPYRTKMRERLQENPRHWYSDIVPVINSSENAILREIRNGQASETPALERVASVLLNSESANDYILVDCSLLKQAHREILQLVSFRGRQ